MSRSVNTMTSVRNIICIILVFLVHQLHAQVKLNELMVYPVGPLETPPNGLIYNGSREYIELYNDTCVPVNVAGYFIAMRQEFNGKVSGGTFRIPAVPQALIPSKGHIVLGPFTAGAAGDVDINMADPLLQPNICQYGTPVPGNFVLSNEDGWCALYDAAGKPLDAIYWTANASRISSSLDYGGTICRPAGSTSITLPNPQQINTQFPGLLKYVGDNFFVEGRTVSRIPDGGNWARDRNSTISNASASKNCNAICYNKTPPVTGFSYPGGADLCKRGKAVPVLDPGFTVEGIFSAPSGVVIDPVTGIIDLEASTAGGPYTINYTVTPNGCTNTGTKDVQINIRPRLDPGGNKSIVICQQAPAINLFDSIVGNPAAGGSWSGPASLTNGSIGRFNPGTMPAGNYIYTVQTTGCPDTSSTVTINLVDCECPVFSGGSSSISVCLNGDLPVLSVPNDATAPYKVQFKYFRSKQVTDTVYAKGTILATVNLNGSATQYDPGRPGTAGSLPADSGKYYIYALLDPLPLNPLCRPIQEWEVTIYPLPEVDAGPNQEIIEGEKATLRPEVKGNYATVSWTPPSTLSAPNQLSTLANPVQTTRYTLKVTTSQSCSVQDTVNVKVYRKLDIPNVFSPNGDGVHERWVIRNLEQFPQNRMRIFNRYGEQILERFAYGSSNAWDGTNSNGSPLPVGPYYFVLELNSSRKPVSGTISILR